MLSLPAELVSFVVREIPSLKDVRVLRAVNKQLCQAATPHAFSRIQLSITLKSARGFAKILRSEKLAQHVQEVILCDGSVNETGESGLGELSNEDDEMEDVTGPMRIAFTLLHRLPALRALTLTFTNTITDDLSPLSEMDVSDEFAFQLSILKAISSASAKARLPVSSLTINNLLAFHDELAGEPGFIANMPSLTHLRVLVLGCPMLISDFHDVDPNVKFWTRTLRPRVLEPPSLQNLTSLALHSSLDIGNNPDTPFTGLHYPLLQRLSLRHFLFSQATGVEEFILRHSTTLTYLELRSCKAFIDTAPAAPRTWSHVFDHFATELVHLRDLRFIIEQQYPEERPVIDPSHPDYFAFMAKYASALPDAEFTPAYVYDSPDSVDEEKDALALQKLQYALALRRAG